MIFSTQVQQVAIGIVGAANLSGWTRRSKSSIAIARDVCWDFSNNLAGDCNSTYANGDRVYNSGVSFWCVALITYKTQFT